MKQTLNQLSKITLVLSILILLSSYSDKFVVCEALKTKAKNVQMNEDTYDEPNSSSSDSDMSIDNSTDNGEILTVLDNDGDYENDPFSQVGNDVFSDSIHDIKRENKATKKSIKKVLGKHPYKEADENLSQGVNLSSIDNKKENESSTLLSPSSNSNSRQKTLMNDLETLEQNFKNLSKEAKHKNKNLSHKDVVELANVVSKLESDLDKTSNKSKDQEKKDQKKIISEAKNLIKQENLRKKESKVKFKLEKIKLPKDSQNNSQKSHSVENKLTHYSKTTSNIRLKKEEILDKESAILQNTFEDYLKKLTMKADNFSKKYQSLYRNSIPKSDIFISNSQRDVLALNQNLLDKANFEINFKTAENEALGLRNQFLERRYDKLNNDLILNQNNIDNLLRRINFSKELKEDSKKYKTTDSKKIVSESLNTVKALSRKVKTNVEKVKLEELNNLKLIQEKKSKERDIQHSLLKKGHKLLKLNNKQKKQNKKEAIVNKFLKSNVKELSKNEIDLFRLIEEEQKLDLAIQNEETKNSLLNKEVTNIKSKNMFEIQFIDELKEKIRQTKRSNIRLENEIDEAKDSLRSLELTSKQKEVEFNLRRKELETRRDVIDNFNKRLDEDYLKERELAIKKENRKILQAKGIKKKLKSQII